LASSPPPNQEPGKVRRGAYPAWPPAWLDSRTDLKPKTRHHYQSLLRQHILPTWGTEPLAKITFEDLSQWVARLSASRLGPSGVRQSVFVTCGNTDTLAGIRTSSLLIRISRTAAAGDSQARSGQQGHAGNSGPRN
jgi:hypothetical protein